MLKRDYDKTGYSGGTATHKATDTLMKEVIENGSSDGDVEAYREGFASASGIAQETAETGGRMPYSERKDAPRPNPVAAQLEKENPGLADTADE